MSVPTTATLEELTQQLHDANSHYHQLREAWEKSLAASEYRHEERIDSARANLQQAEQEIEAIEHRIHLAVNEKPVL